MKITRETPLTIPSQKIKIYECKLCKFKGGRKAVRKHIRENHLARGEILSAKIKSYEFK